MDFLTMAFIAVGLAMDAFAVSVSSGLTIRNCQMRHALRIGLIFGGFQALMPLLGWLSGLRLRRFVAGVDHWIALGLLSFIGIKMIVEATRHEDARKPVNPLKWSVLLVLAVATSIDALAVGFTFAFLDTTIWTPIAVIGGITFVLSFAGVLIGDRFGHFFERKIEIAGGVILIAIGLKIVIEHLIQGR